MTVTDLQQDRLSRMLDRSELAELVARLCRAIDREDHDAILDCYTEDGFDDHGGFKGTAAEFAAYICTPTSLREGLLVMTHLLGSSTFDVEGDEAFGETYFSFNMRREGAPLLYSYGRYVDHLVRTPDGWKVHYRRVVTEFMSEITPTKEFDLSVYVPFARDREDPSYDRRRNP